MLSPGGSRLVQYFDLLQQGVDEKKAFQEAVGSFPEIDKALQQYATHFTFAAAKINNAPQIDQKDFTSRTLSVAETDAELAGYHLWTYDLAGARPLVEEAIKEGPKLGMNMRREVSYSSQMAWIQRPRMSFRRPTLWTGLFTFRSLPGPCSRQRQPLIFRRTKLHSIMLCRKFWN